MTAITTARPSDHWRANLAGEKPPIHANEPRVGHYKRKVGEQWVAASIWIDLNAGLPFVIEGEKQRLLCRVGRDMRDAGKEWLHLAKYPITEAAAFHFYEHGCWPADMAGRTEVADAPEDQGSAGPDAVDPVPRGVGDNFKIDDPFAAFVTEATAEIEAANRWLAATKIETQEIADILGDKFSDIRKLWNRADTLRLGEGEPHRTAITTINTKWKAILAQLDAASAALNAASTAWLTAETARREQERRALEEKQRAEARAATEQGKPAPEAAPIPAAAPVHIGGSKGRRVGLTTRQRLVVTDPSKVWRKFKNDPGVLEALRVAASAVWRADGTVPAGCKIEKDQSATA